MQRNMPHQTATDPSMENALRALHAVQAELERENKAGLYSPLLVGNVAMEETLQFLQTFFRREARIHPLDGWILLLFKTKNLEEVARSLNTAFIENFWPSSQVLYYRSSSKLPLLEKGRHLLQASALLLKRNPRLRMAAEEELLLYHLTEHLSLEMRTRIQQEVVPLFKALSLELQETVRTFHQENLSMGKTAKKLYIHRNTLLYRMGKIKEITGLDCRRSEELLYLLLAAHLGEAEEAHGSL